MTLLVMGILTLAVGIGIRSWTLKLISLGLTVAGLLIVASYGRG